MESTSLKTFDGRRINPTCSVRACGRGQANSTLVINYISLGEGHNKIMNTDVGGGKQGEIWR